MKITQNIFFRGAVIIGIILVIQGIIANTVAFAQKDNTTPKTATVAEVKPTQEVLALGSASGTTSTDNLTPGNKAFIQSNNIAIAVGQDTTANNLTTNANNFTSTLINTYSILYGPQTLIANSKYKDLVSPELAQAGILPTINNTMAQAFFNGPTVDIPAQYAEMLLPKEFRSTADGSAYAGVDNQPPTFENASDDLNKVGIGRLWGISFALAMLGFVVILVYAGFLIIFRQKIGGQTTVTISMSLQNLVIGILFSLSSYALGGLFINLSKYLVLLLSNLMTSTLSGADGKKFQAVFLSGPFALLGHINEFGGLFDSKSSAAYLKTLRFDINDLGATFTSAASFTVWFVVRIVFAGLIAMAGIRIFITVFNVYARMIIDIITAPIYFMISSLPGKQDGYMGWVRKMFKNSLVLPMVFFLVNLALFINGFGSESGITNITGGALNVTNGGSGLPDAILNAIDIRSLVGIMLLFMAPSASTILDELLQTQPSKAAAATEKAVTSGLNSAPVIGRFTK